MAVLREEMQWTLVHGPKYASLVARMSHVDNNILKASTLYLVLMNMILDKNNGNWN